MSDYKELSDVEVGMLDAIMTIMETLLALGVNPSVLGESLRFQRDAQRDAGRADAAAILDVLRDFASDPERQQHRENFQLLHKEPPKGTASAL
jgi:hypothetical protein